MIFICGDFLLILFNIWLVYLGFILVVMIFSFIVFLFNFLMLVSKIGSILKFIENLKGLLLLYNFVELF